MLCTARRLCYVALSYNEGTKAEREVRYTSIDIVTLALARKYTNDMANALGAVRGAPCTIESIVDDGEANTITFGWTANDGTHHTSTMTVKHGVGADELQPVLDQITAAVASAEEATARADAAADRAESSTAGGVEEVVFF